MKSIHYISIAALAVLFVFFALKHEALDSYVNLRSASANVRVSIVNVSPWDRWTAQSESTDGLNVDNRSVIGVDGEQPNNRIGNITVSAWGKTYTLPHDMVRDCFAPRKEASDWRIQGEQDGIYIGTMVGAGIGKTLIWWKVGNDQKIARWVFPMQERRDLSSLPKPTDQPVETKRLVSFDD